jgi:hypothetical protein
MAAEGLAVDREGAASLLRRASRVSICRALTGQSPGYMFPYEWRRIVGAGLQRSDDPFLRACIAQPYREVA